MDKIPGPIDFIKLMKFSDVVSIEESLTTLFLFWPVLEIPVLFDAAADGDATGSYMGMENSTCGS